MILWQCCQPEHASQLSDDPTPGVETWHEVAEDSPNREEILQSNLALEKPVAVQIEELIEQPTCLARSSSSPLWGRHTETYGLRENNPHQCHQSPATIVQRMLITGMPKTVSILKSFWLCLLSNSTKSSTSPWAIVVVVRW